MAVLTSIPGASAASPSGTARTHVDSALLALQGTVLEARYELGRVLGAGGMGAVFEAKHLRLDRPVAIKVLRPVFFGHDDFTRRFLREAKAASKIRQRNVVEILDFGETEGGLFYTVMELLEGRDLRQFLRSQPDQRVDWAACHQCLAQIAAGLKAAHSHGVIHRDIKPANIILAQQDDEVVVKVVDFGIAKMSGGDQTQPLTNTTEVLGTPAYIAPELARTNAPPSPQSDAYSLGVLAYRMLTGQVPFTGATSFEVLHRSCFEPVTPLREHVPELPPAVERFVLSLLAKDPAGRPPDMQAVREALFSLGCATLGPTAVKPLYSGPFAVVPVDIEDPDTPTKTTPLPLRSGRLVAPHEVIKPTELLSPLGLEVDAMPQGHTVVASPEPPPSGSEDASSPSFPEGPVQEAVAPGDSGRRRGALAGLGVGSLVGGAIALWAMGMADEPRVTSESSPPIPVVVEPSGPPAIEERERTGADEGRRVARSEDSNLEAEATASAQGPDPLAHLPRSEPEPDPERQLDQNQASQGKGPAGAHRSSSKTDPTTRAIVNLRRRIKSRCLDKGEAVKVSFLIPPSGPVLALAITPSDGPGGCTREVIAAASFPARPAPRPVKFIVKSKS